ITVLGDKRRNLATYQFAGVKLADITTPKFSTYNSLSGNTAGIGSNRSGYLNFNVDFNDATYFPVDSWQRRLAYVPSINGTVLQDTWQEWDAISSGNAKWWWSGFVGNGNKWPDGNTTEYRTLSDLLLVFPNMRIRVSDPWLGIRVGEPYADGYTENIDAFKFGTASDTAIFDFEPLVGPPTTYAECKGNGWKSFNNPSFTKKEKCEKYVKDNLHTIKGNDVIYTANGLKREADFNMSTAEDGSFEYDDAAKGWYNVKVSSVKVNGNLGWFAGRVVKASNPAWVGLWLFGKVEDNGPDKVWGSFTDETTAKAEVAAMSTPADGPFPVTKKDIKVK
ncbi:MAG: hypothetical protein KBD46_00685, partial [Candidatus Levybacteria bacterium]|nr:hypothetical protein [Candidatus Levybacteria bacterium]